MAIKVVEGSINVVEASKQRIKNAFDTGLTVKLSMSGGKDSICLAGVIYSLIQSGEVDAKQLVVQFVDEEAIFDDVEQIVLDWRLKFLLAGAKFEWYCIQIKHFNCLDSLSDDETFITWDRYEKENWVRPMPKFAIKTHPMLNERKDTYQQFLERINVGSIQLIGIRTAESSMRMQNIASIMGNTANDGGLNSANSMFPIYDWSDDDVWLYIKENNLDFPKTYMDLWAVGEGRRGMRISQFFSIDTAKVLVNLDEYQPNLMKRVIKREPNAYLASLYWESEMFRRASPRGRRKKDEDGNEIEEDIDYKKLVMALLSDINKNFETEVKRKTAETVRGRIFKFGAILEDKHYQTAYQILQAGDPKERAIRGWTLGIMSNGKATAEKDVKRRGGK